jgi:hypothetical protein
MKKNKAAKMKTVRAWAMVDAKGGIARYILSDDGDPMVLRTRSRARKRLCSGDRIARIEIREVPK